MITQAIPRAAARLPQCMSSADEFLHLTEQRRQIDRRLDELAEVLGPVFGIAGKSGSATLPKSGLRIVASQAGSLTCKGGRL